MDRIASSLVSQTEGEEWPHDASMLVRSFAGKKDLMTMEAMDRKSVDVVPQNADVVLLVGAGRISSMS